MTKLLIVTRLEMEREFTNGKKNRNTLWKKCVEMMKNSVSDFNLSPIEVRKKFNNLIVTYNRIEKRKEKSGRAPVFWEYFENFDSVYGVRHNVVPPKENLFDSSNEINIVENVVLPLSSQNTQNVTPVIRRITALPN